MGMIGADLGALDQLASRFTAAGSTFQTESSAIAGRVDDALAKFVERMRALDTQGRVLADEITTEMQRLDGQANSTEWTGGNRQKMDEHIATLDDDIVAIRSAIDSFLAEASGVVNGSLTTAMTDLNTNATTNGTTAQTAADSFSRSVAGQRASFDAVMNGTG